MNREPAHRERDRDARTHRSTAMKIATPRIVLSGHSTSLPKAPADHQARSGKGLWAAIAAFWREFFQTAFTPYYPERHYMRGPGPACAKRKAAAK